MLSRLQFKTRLNKKSRRPVLTTKRLRIESLEERRVMAAVAIAAAGSTGQEEMQLLINDSVVRTFTNIGGNPSLRHFQDFVTNVPDTTKINQIKVRFTNDLYDPARGIDRNLFVDDIRFTDQFGNTTQIEAESSTVFSNGTWTPADGIVPGYGRGEALNRNSYFQFSDGTNQGSSIVINAKGLGGAASFDLLIDGKKVSSYVANATSAPFTYQATRPITADRIRVQFTGDRYDPANNIDVNLQVDSIVVDGMTYRSNAFTVFSTGTWLAADGVTPGYARGVVLNANGYFQYNARPAQNYQLINAIGEDATLSKVDSVTGRYATIEGTGAGSGQVVLYEANGRRVSTFGNNGVAPLLQFYPQGTTDTINVTTISFFSDGSLLLTGASTNTSPAIPYLFKIKTDGKLDTTFRGNDTIRPLLGDATSGGLNIGAVVDASNNITVVGTKLNSSTAVTAIRLQANGTLNTGWGASGVRNIEYAATNVQNAYFKNVFLLSNGSLLVDVARQTTTTSRVVVRITPQGAFDTTYGFRTALPEDLSVNGSFIVFNAQSQVDSLGRIVFVSFNDIVRLAANGRFDSTFGQGGKVQNTLKSGFRREDSFTIDKLNRILVVKNNVVFLGKILNQYLSTDIMRLTASGAIDTDLDGDGVQNLNLRGQVVGVDKSGNLLLSTAAIGFSNDPATFKWRLSRYRFR